MDEGEFKLMGEKSHIQWTDHTWNPWHGCKKVSEGCKYCYMYRDKDRYGQDATKVIRSKTKFKEPLKWKEPAKVFTCSWSDFFIEEADEWRAEAWEIIKATPHLTYQILTKRPERILQCLPEDWGEGYENVWLGVSVENQERAYERIYPLLKVPAKIRFLSCEPIIGRLDIPNYFNTCGCGDCDYCKEFAFNQYNTIHWVIIGGESGNDEGKWKYRPSELQWYNELVGDCQLHGVPVFVKQLGTHLAKELKLKDRNGGNIDEFPEQLQVREFPN